MERLVCVIIGYVFGLFQTGYIYGKLHHIDIREHESGNAGATNVLRVLGKRAGIITYLGDCLKAVCAGFLVRLIFGESHASVLPMLLMYSGMGVILGHNYPFYLRFKGGKGIAAASGMILAFDWRLAVCVCVCFIIVAVVTRYVSLASLVLMGAFMALLLAGGQLGWFLLTQGALYEVYALGAALTILAFYKHKENIKRLFHGTERKLGASKDVK